MSLLKIGKFIKKALITFICFWLITTTMPVNVVFAEGITEETLIDEVEGNEEESVLEEQEIEEEIVVDEEENSAIDNDNEEEIDDEEIEDEEEPLLSESNDANETNNIALYKNETSAGEVASFKDAVDAVNNDEADKIELLANISISDTYTFENNVTIDLNEKKIVVSQKNESIIFSRTSSISNGTISVSDFGTNATEAVIVVNDNAGLHIEEDAIIKSRVAFKLNDGANLYISDNAEVNARDLIDTIYSNTNVYIEDEPQLHLVSDVSNSTGYGYWRTANSANNGTITITGGKFTNNQYPTYEGYTITSKLSDYYDQNTYSDIELDDETYKYQVIKGGGITFDVQGGTWTDSFDVPLYYEFDNRLPLPTSENISKAGYTFDGWKINGEDQVVTEIQAGQTGTIVLVATWTARTDVKYTVKHIYELPENLWPTEEGDFLKVKEFYGTTDTLVTPDFEEKQGYANPNKQTKKIAGDGSTVFEYYYRLGASELVVYSKDERKGTVAIDGYPNTAAAIADGTQVTIVATPTSGFKFVKWVDTFNEETVISTSASHEFTMGNSSISYTAVFEADSESDAWAIKVKTTQVSRASDICYQQGEYYFYQTLADAVEFVKNGAEIELIEDVTSDESAVVEKQISINLNGNTIEQLLSEDLYEMANQLIMVSPSGDLTINGPGEIKTDVDDQWGYFQNAAIYNNGGVLTLDKDVSITTTGRNVSSVRCHSGTIYINDANITSNMVALSIRDGGVEINEGAVIKNTSEKVEKGNSYYYYVRRQSLIFLESYREAIVNINDGVLTSTSESMFGSEYSYYGSIRVKGGVLNPSDSGYLLSNSNISVEITGGTVNSNNYLFADYGGVIYDGHFNIKNGISSKNYYGNVYGGKFHVYYQDPSKINALAVGYSVTENIDDDKDEYEYIVLSKSTLTFNTNNGNDRKFINIQSYKTRTIEEELIPEDPTWIGYSFGGWYFDNMFTEEFDIETFKPTKDSYSLYAKWNLNPSDPVWVCRLKTNKTGLDETRKYVDNGITYYYYMLNENNKNDVGYEFGRVFEEAIDHDTIELLKDVTLRFDTSYYYSNITNIKYDDITFDLKDHTLTFSDNYLAMFYFENSGCTKFTIKNGSVVYNTLKNTYSKDFFESRSSITEVISINVDYSTNFVTPQSSSWMKVVLAGDNIRLKVQGGSVSDNICLIDSFTTSNTLEIVNGYDFSFAGEVFNYSYGTNCQDKLLLKGGIYVYDPDYYAAHGYVSSEKKQTVDEVEYNYEIIPGYKVYFDFNDKKTDTVKINVPTSVGHILVNQVPSIPDRSGYEFTGWYTQKDGGTKVEDVTDVSLTDDVTYYAHWQTASLTVDFELNDGEVQGGANEITVNYKGKYPALPAPTKEGYYFSGWYTEDQVDAADDYPPLIEEGSDVILTENHTLYAHWTAKSITVTFDCNGGFCVSNLGGSTEYSNFSIIVDYDSTYLTDNKELPKPERAGYEFAGWYTQKDGGTKIEEETFYSEHPSDTLYAHWTSTTHNVTFYNLYAHDNTSGKQKSDTLIKELPCNVAFGNELVTPIVDDSDYYFVGWNTDDLGRGEWIDEDSIFITDSDNYSLYAIYDNTLYDGRKIYLDYGYNISNPSYNQLPNQLYYSLTSNPAPTKLFEYDGTSGYLPEPERTGYSFDGWKIENTLVSGDTLISNVFTDEQVRYKKAIAQWSIETDGAKATFYANGGEFVEGQNTSSTKVITQTIGNTYTLPSTNPTKKGYDFVGWILVDGYKYSFEDYNTINGFKSFITRTSIVEEDDCLFAFADSYESHENGIMLYAVWEPASITYTIYHMFINPGYDLNVESPSYPNYYKEPYTLVDTEEYTVDNDSYVLIKPKEYDGVSVKGATFDYGRLVHVIEYNEDYSYQPDDLYSDSDKPTIYYESSTYKVIVDYNADDNYKVEQNDELITHKEYDKKYRDTFNDNPDSDSLDYYLQQVYPGKDSTNPGYKFVKWVDDNRNNVLMYDETEDYPDQYKPTFMPAEDFTVHAVWEPITYTIKYDKTGFEYSDDIEGEMEDQIVTFGDKNDKYSKNKFTRPGYDFVGWSRECHIDAIAEYADEQAIEEVVYSSLDYYEGLEIILYPVWRAKEYTVTYHVNGGELSSYSGYDIIIEDDCFTYTATYDENIWLPFTTDFVKDGYTTEDSGWYVDVDGDYPYDGTDEEKDDWYAEEGHDQWPYFAGGGWESKIYQFDRDVDVYLRWVPNEYKFVFSTSGLDPNEYVGMDEVAFDTSDIDDGIDKNSIIEINEKFNEKLEFPKFVIRTEFGDETPRPGYDFDGWYIEYQDPITEQFTYQSISEDQIFDEDFYNTYVKEPVLDGREVYVYAKWKAKKDVKYKINIFLQDLYDNSSYSGNPTYPDEPVVTYEMTGTPWSELDFKELLSHKKYQYKGFKFYDDWSPSFYDESTVEHEYNSQRYTDRFEWEKSYIICADSSSVFNVYYSRQVYNVYAYLSRHDINKDHLYENCITPPESQILQYNQEIDWQLFENQLQNYPDLPEEFNSFVVNSPATINELPEYMPAEDLIVVATYKGDEFDITFDANGGTFKDGYTTRVVSQFYDTLFNVPQEIPYKENYAFDGWYLDDGTKIERVEDYYVSFRGNRTAKAHWAKPLVEVSIEDEEDSDLNSLAIYSNLVDASRKINEEYNKKVTIKLLEDTTVHDGATFSAEDITLDLNGHTLFFEANSDTDFIIFADSNVTVTDSSSYELGKLVSNGLSTIRVNDSSFTMDSGSLENQSTESSRSVLYVNNHFTDNIVNIIGGSIIYNNNSDYSIDNPSCIYNNNSSTIIIGSDSSKDKNIVLSLPYNSYGNIVNNLNNVTINGGIFIAQSGTLGSISSDKDDVTVSSGYFELKEPIENNIQNIDPTTYKKEIYTGGFFNIENIDAIDNYITDGRVIINSFGGYFGNNSYLYFYEIGDKLATTVHFVVTVPSTQEKDPTYAEVIMDDVYTGNKIKDLNNLPTPTDSEGQYYFVGWTTSPDGNNNVTIISNAFEHTLYSLWAKKTHTLKFTVADKTKDIKEQEIQSSTIDITGSYPELPSASEVERTNPKYKFGGWYTSTNKLVKEGDPFVMSGIIDDSEIVLHAKWIEADIYLVKMNSRSRYGNKDIKSVANLSCDKDVVYENIDSGILAENNDNSKYEFSYWKVNDYVVQYDSTNHKWKVIKDYGEESEETIKSITVEQEKYDDAENKHFVELNFTEFIRPDSNSKDIDVYAVYEYIGKQGSVLRVEGYKTFKVVIEEGTASLLGLLTETKTTTYEAVQNESTGLYEVVENVTPGSPITITYDNKDQDFSSWVNSSNVILTSCPELETTIAVDTTIKLKTKSDDGDLEPESYYIEFRNYSGLFINSGQVSSEADLTSLINSTLVPSMIGYTFQYWSIDYTKIVTFEAIKTAAGGSKKTVVLRPIYNVTKQEGDEPQPTPKVSVGIYASYGGRSYELSRFNEQVGASRYITAPKYEDKEFSYWLDESNYIIGYTERYAISIVDTNKVYNYIAVYNEPVTNKEPIITLNGYAPVIDGLSHKIAFSVTRSIPDDYELLEQGIIYSTSSSLSSLSPEELAEKMQFIQDPDTKGWSLDSVLKTYVGASKDKVNVLTVKFDRTGKENNPIYLRGYIIVKYKNKEDIDILYTNYEKLTYNELKPSEGGE